MLDATQLLLVLVVLVLTVMLVVIGVQVSFILRELKRSIDKLNRVLDNAEEITETIGKPAAGVTSLLAGLREGIQLFRSLKKREDHG